MSAAVNLWTILERAEALFPRSLAVVDGERRLDYAAVARRARSIAASLQARGLVAGDRVAILAPNSSEFFAAYFAAAGAGLALCPLNVRLSAGELSEILDDSGARVLLADHAFEELAQQSLARAASVEAIAWLGAEERALAHPNRFALDAPAERFIRAQVGGDALAQLYYTSGTTARAKGVMLTHRNVATHALGAIAELQLAEADVWAHVAPMFHLADAWATFALTWVGGRHVFAPRFDERAVLELFERERVTITNLVPTMLQRLVRFENSGSRDLSSFRRILSGGAPIAPEVVRRVMDVFRCEYVQTYGMTETSPYLTLSLLKEHLKSRSPEEQFRFRAKTGRAFATVELEVVGEDGRAIARDGRSVGEIRVRGETVTPGYWNRPDETARAFAGEWLCTGDLATIDEEGYVQIVDRKKDLINSGGEKIYSTEVEHVLYAHPCVLEAAVFGVADPEWGERVEAAVVVRERSELEASELEDFCRERLAGFKVPKRFHFLSELPKTGTGKISKRLLRDTVESEHGGS